MTQNTVVLFGDTEYIQSRPIAVYTLASYLRSHGIPTQTIWGWRNLSWVEFYSICKKFLNDQVLVVGFSSTMLADLTIPNNFFGISHSELSKRMELIKKLAPNAKIVVGGSQTTYGDINNVEGKEFVDLFVKGQGEEVLLEIVKSVAENTTIKTTSLVPKITSDRVYPFNDFPRTVTQFESCDHLIHGEAIPIEFARGCIFKCSFCSYELTGKKVGDYTKGYETLRAEFISNYEKYGTTHYFAADDLINDSEDKVNLILDVSQSLPFKLQYTGYLRLDLIRRYPSMASKLKDSGLIGCFFGIETINDGSGKSVGKGLGLNRVNEALEVCEKAWNGSVMAATGIILGLPKDTRDTKNQVLEWLKSDLTSKVITEIFPQALYINPELGLSEIDKDPAQFGYRPLESNIDDIKYRYPGQKFMLWETDNYSFPEAVNDAKSLIKEYYTGKKYKTLSIFSLPYILSLSEHKEEIMQLVLKNHSTLWKDNQEWQSYLDALLKTHRAAYLKSLLSK